MRCYYTWFAFVLVLGLTGFYLLVLKNASRQTVERELNLHRLHETFNATTGAISSEAVSDARTRQTTATQLPTTPAIIRPKRVDQYVTFARGFVDGRGLGNQLFDFATVVYVAELTGRRPTMLRFPYRVSLEEVFDLRGLDDLCPCHTFGEDKSLSYDARLENLARMTATVNKSIVIDGFFQSWKYTRAVDRRLRSYLNFQPNLVLYVYRFFNDSVPPGWNRAFVRVGIHVRRRDVLTKGMIEFGYTTPDAGYFHRAMDYFVTRYERVQFIVCSNDIEWVRANLTSGFHSKASQINVVIALGLKGQDMALLAACDHVIMSTGTFGWWAAWLAKGTTVYYADWPRNGTWLWKMFRKQDFFPPSWIGMT